MYIMQKIEEWLNGGNYKRFDMLNYFGKLLFLEINEIVRKL